MVGDECEEKADYYIAEEGKSHEKADIRIREALGFEVQGQNKSDCSIGEEADVA